jgi:hypothetical protein
MQAFDPAGRYIQQDVVDALTGRYGPRQISFRYERLDTTNAVLDSITNYVEKAHISYDRFASIKRTATFSLLDRSSINYLKDRIRPWVRLAMRDGGFVEWPQGVFILSTPKRRLDPNGVTVIREVVAYDLLQALTDDKILARSTVTAGTLYTSAIATYAAGYVLNITPSASVLPTALDWPPATSKLAILNQLLGAINYESAFFDELGTFVARPYLSPSVRPAEFDYNTGSASVISGQIEDTLDLFAIPNVFVLTVTEPDQSVLTSTYTNSNPLSPTSTVSRGRSIPSFITSTAAPDQPTLDALAAREAFTASQVYDTVSFSTVLMPMHSNADVYTLNLAGLGIGDKFGEHAWSFDLVVGATMAHSARRIVNV